MSADVSFLLGYGGYANMQLRNVECSQPLLVDSSTWTIVPLLNGNYDRTMTVPMQSTFSTLLSDKKRGNSNRNGCLLLFRIDFF